MPSRTTDAVELDLIEYRLLHLCSDLRDELGVHSARRVRLVEGVIERIVERLLDSRLLESVQGCGRGGIGRCPGARAVRIVC